MTKRDPAEWDAPIPEDFWEWINQGQESAGDRESCGQQGCDVNDEKD